MSGTVDTSGFFAYPVGAPASTLPAAASLFADRPQADWDMLLSFTQARRFRRGEVVLTAGEVDRALYLLVDGQVEAPSGLLEPIAALGIGGFADGLPRAVSVRAVTDGEVVRLGFTAFEALAARDPLLARDLLIDVGRMLAAPLRTAGEHLPGWTG